VRDFIGIIIILYISAIGVGLAYRLGHIEGMIAKHHKMMIVGIETVGDCIDGFEKGR